MMYAEELLGYNVTVGSRPKFMWYRNAKVATRTTLHFLDNTDIDYHIREGYSIFFRPADIDEYFKFGFVRNPWDRFISGWLNKIVRVTTKGPKWFNTIGHELADLVSYLETCDMCSCNIHFRLQSRNVPVKTVDFIGRHETFEADLRHVVTRLGVEAPGPFTSRNVSNGRMHYREYFTPALRDRVAKLYRSDIDAFEYEF